MATIGQDKKSKGMKNADTKFVELIENIKLNNCSVVLDASNYKQVWLSVKVTSNDTKKEVEQLIPYTMQDLEMVLFATDYCIKKLTNKKTSKQNGKAKK
jgi:hypothetical protein